MKHNGKRTSKLKHIHTHTHTHTHTHEWHTPAGAFARGGLAYATDPWDAVAVERTDSFDAVRGGGPLWPVSAETGSEGSARGMDDVEPERRGAAGVCCRGGADAAATRTCCACGCCLCWDARLLAGPATSLAGTRA
jgi:hypothetical protein